MIAAMLAEKALAE
jgi:hypothetical protein